MLADISGKNRLRRLGFNVPVGRITAHQAVMLNEAAEELPSESDITNQVISGLGNPHKLCWPSLLVLLSM